jgi:hypothetical protein
MCIRIAGATHAVRSPSRVCLRTTLVGEPDLMLLPISGGSAVFGSAQPANER